MKDARAVAAVCCMIPGGEEAEMEAEMEGDNISKIPEKVVTISHENQHSF